ncbi:MAG: translocation/assembly module TamB domain-containing protein [Amaricoccus sp.]|uniref:translocation/assembly module TamB domain-containing protein n=1 Tax=Amaricoccus sp. TaxID=1872485 RepID=UPI0039E3D229
MKRILALLSVLLLVAIAAVAQDEANDPGDNTFITRFIQNRISAPGREIHLSGVSGALSSSARIQRITVSDDQGPWLQIENAQLDWSRLALLRGRLTINRLAADQILWLRRPVMPPAPKQLPQAETQPFSLPELPVAVNLRDLSVPLVRFSQPVFGQAADISVAGRLTLADGALDTALDIKRLDQPGGTLALNAAFSNASRQLDLDVALHEPKGGIVATLLRIEGTPAVDLTLAGSGPLEKVDVNFALDADQTRVAAGLVALRARDDGLGFDVDFGGDLAPLIPAQFRDFFAGHSSVRAQGVSKTGGGVRVDTLALANDVLKLDGSLETGTNYLRRLTLTGNLGDPAGPPITLPVPGARTRLNSAALHVTYGDAAHWDGLLVLDRLQAADLAMEDVTFRMGGLAQNLDDPATRNVTVNVEGLATGLSSPRPEVANALGKRIDLFADAVLPPGGPATINQLQLSGNGLSIFSAGELKNFVYTGRNSVRVADLAIFAGLANRDLGGAIDLTAEGSVSPLVGGFDLAFDGTANDVRVGISQVDPLLAGETTLSGRVVRDSQGFRTEDLKLANPQLAFASNGQVSSTKTDIGFEASISDLGLVDPRLGGALTASGHASGAGQPVAVSLTAAIPTGHLADRALTNATLGFNGSVNGTDVMGTVTGGGGLDGLTLSLAGDIASVGQDRSVKGLEVIIGPNRLSGDLARSGSDPLVGRLNLHAPDVASVAALALVDARGAVDADLTFAPVDVGQGAAGQRVKIAAGANGVAVGATRVGQLNLQADVTDAFGVPLVDGTLNASDVAAGGIAVSSLNATASRAEANRMQLSANARLAIGTQIDTSGELAHLDGGGVEVTLASLNLRQQDMSATLAAPSTVTVQGGNVMLTPLKLSIGNGSLTAEGKVADTFDVDVALSAVPLAIANTIQPALALAGTVDGRVRITGPRGAPDVTYDLTAADVASAITRNAGLPPVHLVSSGQTQAGRLVLTANLSGNGIAASANGAVPLGQGNIDLAIELGSFPLALVDRAAGSRGLRGTVAGTGRVTGTLASPQAVFNVHGTGITANLLSSNGLPALGFTLDGNFRSNTVRLESARLTAPGGLDIAGSGTIPLAGPGLDVRVNGSVPLAVANPFLAERAAQVAGTARIDATARGALTAPQLGGTVKIAGATFVDPQTNVRLEGITLDAALQGNAAILHTFRANVVSGGSIEAEGRVTLAAGYPADLTARINDVVYTDGAFVSTRANGTLAMRGPLVGRGGMLTGQIDLGRTEISVAEGLGAGGAALDQVEHRAPPRPVSVTLKRARLNEPRRADSSPPQIGLDILVRAPNQIFVRGRGLDVEVGGELRVQGTMADIQPVGQFDLRRGRINILTQRIEFDEGSVQLIGNLDPQLRFVAETQSGDVTAIVTVEGRASAPTITFSSQPELPQDEVVARVLFNRATDSLSPFQLAQLAAAMAELAGGGGPGIMDQLRNATGLDDLDVVTTEDGATAVRAGRYISDRVYVDVQSDTRGVSQAQVNYQISNSLNARGSVGTDGNTTIGLFFERDY